MKVAHVNLDDIEAVTGLSLLSTLGMITAIAATLFHLYVHCLQASPGTSMRPVASILRGANLPDGLDEANRSIADILAQDADNCTTSDGDDTPPLWRTLDLRWHREVTKLLLRLTESATLLNGVDAAPSKSPASLTAPRAEVAADRRARALLTPGAQPISTRCSNIPVRGALLSASVPAHHLTPRQAVTLSLVPA